MRVSTLRVIVPLFAVVTAMAAPAVGQTPAQPGPAAPVQRNTTRADAQVPVQNPNPTPPPTVSPQAGAPAAPAAASPSTSAQTPVSYTVGPQDLLNVTVFDEPDLSNKYRVDADGMMTFPLIGRVSASGLTLAELQDRLKSLLAAGYVKNPQVRVEVEQYKAQNVYVIGEVRSPNKYTMTGTMSLIEALALAGSPTNAASQELIVVHPRKPGQQGAATVTTAESDEDAERTRVNIKDLQVGKAGKDIVLADGDTVYVPRAQAFYITGQIKGPGAYVLDPGMTLLQALSLAGGVTETGSDRGIKIQRIVNGKRVEVDAKLSDLIQPGDTIIVRRRFF